MQWADVRLQLGDLKQTESGSFQPARSGPNASHLSLGLLELLFQFISSRGSLLQEARGLAQLLLQLPPPRRVLLGSLLQLLQCLHVRGVKHELTLLQTALQLTHLEQNPLVQLILHLLGLLQPELQRAAGLTGRRRRGQCTRVGRIEREDRRTSHTSFSFFRLSSSVSTTARYCSTEALAFFSCSASSTFCSSAVRRRPFTSASSCSDWLSCWEAAGTGERTDGPTTNKRAVNTQTRCLPSGPRSGARSAAALEAGVVVAVVVAAAAVLPAASEDEADAS
ncbi:hypothetical protein EYF80_029408 [Liparis tanakae]|uniref:Uncharacterized protein n=1 Tax=Liparis tanakae TaxID=230148 RepID=A0A4Z2H3U7_9TELE|nr:hypothetical protein EYF80_029408 [Liparis tanakae]